MNPSGQTNLMLVDDQQAVRELLGNYLTREGHNYQVVADASNGAQALEEMAVRHPSIVIADVFLPDMPALEFLHEAKRVDADTAIIAFCRWINKETAVSLVGAGVRGVVLKDQSLESLLAAIAVVQSGGLYIPPAFQAFIMGGRQAANILTEREATALRLIAEGLATKQMGDRMNISVKTAEKYRERIMSKLRLHDVVSLTRYAIRHGFATL